MKNPARPQLALAGASKGDRTRGRILMRPAGLSAASRQQSRQSHRPLGAKKPTPSAAADVASSVVGMVTALASQRQQRSVTDN